jgi:tRNA 2-thiocytidine biosynthesis protein TtcA
MTQLVSLSRRAEPRSAEELLVHLRRRVGEVMRDFPMIDDGDRIMVCVSGGKDSYALLDVLMALKERAPIRYELIAVNIDQGWPGYDTGKIEAHLREVGCEYRMIQEDYARLVEERLKPGQTPCSLCSRFRRGVLYGLAQDLGCQKIALGHHRDDLVETLLLNLFYSGRLASMPAVLESDDGQNRVIRPLAYVPEEILVQYAEMRRFPVVRCGCPSCGLPEQKRQVIKRLLSELSKDSPELKNHMLAALGNVSPTHLLDPTLGRISGADSPSSAS